MYMMGWTWKKKFLRQALYFIFFHSCSSIFFAHSIFLSYLDFLIIHVWSPIFFPYWPLQSIPLFKNFLWSNSVNFKSERLWMLRLIYVGINVDDDARLYIKNSIHEDLQSFYVSSLSDNESKELILQVNQVHGIIRVFILINFTLACYVVCSVCFSLLGVPNNQLESIYHPPFLLNQTKSKSHRSYGHWCYSHCFFWLGVCNFS